MTPPVDQPPAGSGSNLPVLVWGTKGFQFWTFLSLLLLDVAPMRILELGAGRSTLIFAEYAAFKGATFLSLETNRLWRNKVRLDLRGTRAKSEIVHLVGVDPATSWYDVERFRTVTRSDAGFDFVLIDGPNRVDGDSRGIRDAPIALEEIRHCIAGANVVIVDDVHRRHVLRTIDPMLDEPAQYERHFYDYAVNRLYTNVLCICTRKGSPASVAVPRIARFLNARIYSTLTEADCPQD